MENIYNAIHPNIDNVELHKCLLVLICGDSYVYSAILNQSENAFLFYDKMRVHDSLQLNFKDYFNRYGIMPERFRKVLVFFNIDESLLAPQKQYSEQDLKLILNLFTYNTNHKIILKDNIDADTVNIYAVQKKLYDAIYNLQTERIVFCNYQSILFKLTDLKYENLYIKNKFYARLVLDQERYVILLFHNKKLLYVNSFKFFSIADTVYKLLTLTESLKIEMTDFGIYISHFEDIGFETTLTDFLSLYFLNIEIENRPLGFTYQNLMLHNTSSTFLAPLFELILCEL